MKKNRNLGWYQAVLALALMLLGSAALAEDVSQPPETGVTVREVGDARIIQAVLPGRSLGTRLAPGAGVAILLATEEDSDGPSLYRFDPSGDGTLVELAHDLPPEVDTISVLGTQVIAGGPDQIYSLGNLADPDAGRRPRLLLEAPELDLDLLRRRGLIAKGRVFVPRPRLGRLDVYRWDENGARSSATEIEMPLRARRVRTGLVLSTPKIRLLEREGELPLIAIGPELQGKRRLLTTLVDPDTSAGAGNADGGDAGGDDAGRHDLWVIH